MTTIQSLPKEILVEIFQYLTLEDIITSVQHVSHAWKFASQDFMLWKRLKFKPPTHMDTTYVIKLLRLSPLLESFQFHDYLNVNEILGIVVEFNTNLKHLYMGNSALHPYHIRTLQDAEINLESIQVSVDDILLLISNFTNLKKIKSTLPVDGIWNDYNGGDVDDEFFEFDDFNKTIHTSDPKILSQRASKLLDLEVTCAIPNILKYIGYCTGLTKLSLNFLSNQVPPKALEQFFKDLKNLKNLQILHLTSCVHPKPNILDHMFHNVYFLSLVEINLHHFMNITPETMRLIVLASPELKIVKLEGCVTVNDGILQALSKCNRLQHLNIAGCCKVTEVGLSSLSQNQELQNINCSWIGLVSKLMLFSIAKIPKLQVLILDHNEINFSDIQEALSMMPNLRMVSVVSTEIDGYLLQQNVSHCKVKYCRTKLQDMMIEKLDYIRSLQLIGLPQDIMKCVSFYSRVEELSINFLGRCCNLDDVISYIKRTHLLSLSLKNMIIGDENAFCSIFQEESLKDLKMLDLQHTVNVGSLTVQNFVKGCPDLEHLELKGCVLLNDDDILALTQLKSLHFLSISLTPNISVQHLISFSTLPHLQELHLSGIYSLPENVLHSLQIIPKLVLS